jgi:hypothetical protein
MQLDRRRWIAFAPLVLLQGVWAAPCSAEARASRSVSSEANQSDSPAAAAVVARSETYLQLFRRALLPGPNGALIRPSTAAPIHQYLLASARDISTAAPGALDLDFGAWARLWPTDSRLERPFDGDVQTASVRYRVGPFWARLGRQQVTGGAARYARFDGVLVGAAHPLGIFAEGYSGFSVLPRWDERPGYHHLGSLEDELVRRDDELADRRGHWLAGTRLGYASSALGGSLSLHEQRERGGVAFRNLGVDASARPFDGGSVGGSALLELDGRRLAMARAWLDATPHPSLDAGAEFLRAEPALLLSRQSVFSVFTADGYDELGATLTFRAKRWVRFESAGYLQLYHGERPGARGEVTARLVADRSRRTLVRATYTRVLVPENGYHSLRTALSRDFSRTLAATLEAYGYFYDRPVAGHTTSSVYAGTLAYRVLESLEVLWGGSLARSPYAALDAQTLLRVSYQLVAPEPAGRR